MERSGGEDELVSSRGGLPASALGSIGIGMVDKKQGAVGRSMK